MLALPYDFMRPLLNSAPRIPRNLTLPKANKQQDYLQWADLLIRRFPSDTSGRMVEFLLDLVQNTEPGQAPPLPWYTSPRLQPIIRVGQPAVAAHVVPSVKFRVNFLRQR